MKWYIIDEEYIDYLKSFDSHVPNVNYGRYAMKCFLGIPGKINGFNYFAPLTSFKDKFMNWENDVDFYKIQDRRTKDILGAIYLKNMIPVPNGCFTEITFDNIGDFREFKDMERKEICWQSLNREMYYTDEKYIIKNSRRLIKNNELYPDGDIAKRSCKFKVLEEKCLEYGRNITRNKSFAHYFYEDEILKDDFFNLSKDAFLDLYDNVSEEEWDATAIEVGYIEHEKQQGQELY